MTAALYLRRSREDPERDGEHDTLSRHREILLDLAAKTRVVIADVYEEVVSGESLYRRPEMLRLLDAVEQGKYDAVLCMAIDRLGRGNMREQGLILEAFKLSGTKIITPEKTYDLALDIDEILTEFQAFMSRQEYKLISKRLRRGLDQTIAGGGYVANAPYGYRKTTIDKKPSLEIVASEARFVHLIFDMYCDGTGAELIARRLNALGSVPHRSERWNRNSVRHILRNPTFCGKIIWYKKRHIKPGAESPKHKTKYLPESEWRVYDGLHEAIITPGQFERAQEIRRGRYIPPSNDGTVKSPLAGLVKCSVCGQNMQRMGAHKSKPYLLCNTTGCSAGAKLEYVETALLAQIRDRLTELTVELETQDAGAELARAEETLALIRRSAAQTAAQKEKIYSLLEQGVYDVAEYRERMDAVTTKLAELERQEATAAAELARHSTEEKAALRDKIQNALAIYHTADAAGRNALLKTILEKVEYTKHKKTKPHDFSLELTFCAPKSLR
jgi:DNA invertase Pin-like site-specific DNA recombinase/DNA-binding PadR family transcriptional regulator